MLVSNFVAEGVEKHTVPLSCLCPTWAHSCHFENEIDLPPVNPHHLLPPCPLITYSSQVLMFFSTFFLFHDPSEPTSHTHSSFVSQSTAHFSLFPPSVPLRCLDFFHLLPSACPVGLPFLLTLWYFESFEPSPRNFWPFFTNDRFQPYVKVARLFKTFNQLRWPYFFLCWSGK